MTLYGFLDFAVGVAIGMFAIGVGYLLGVLQQRKAKLNLDVPNLCGYQRYFDGPQPLKIGKSTLSMMRRGLDERLELARLRGRQLHGQLDALADAWMHGRCNQVNVGLLVAWASVDGASQGLRDALDYAKEKGGAQHFRYDTYWMASELFEGWLNEQPESVRTRLQAELVPLLERSVRF